MICMLFYYAGHDSFMGMGLYGMGTTVFVGTCNTLQWKVSNVLGNGSFFCFNRASFDAFDECIIVCEMYPYHCTQLFMHPFTTFTLTTSSHSLTISSIHFLSHLYMITTGGLFIQPMGLD